MKHTLVKPDGTLGQTRDFDEAPILATNKGKWLPDNPPAFDPATHVRNRALVQSVDAVEIAYEVTAHPLPELKAAKIAQMETAYAGAVQQPVSYMGTTFQADTGSQAILTSTLVALNAAGAVPGGFGWWDINNAKVPMTLPELNGLAGAMLAQGWAAFQNKQAKKDAARAAATSGQVDAVAW